MKFVVHEWSHCEDVYGPKLHNCQLIIVCGTSCVELASPDGLHIVETLRPDLRCNHKEADTRLLLHVVDEAKSRHSNIVVSSPDTNVAV